MLVGACDRALLLGFASLDLGHVIRLTGLGCRPARRLGQSIFDHRLAVVDGGIGRGFIDGFAGKAAQIDFSVGGNDHRVGGSEGIPGFAAEMTRLAGP